MKKILLTSAGFENDNIKTKFMELIDKDSNDIKALFITTAAIEADAIMVLPKCLEDLFKCGISKDNITVYDMHKLIDIDKLMTYDVIYVCGGKTSYLVDRMNEVGFKDIVYEYIANGGIYVGVSAGSVAASGKYNDGLNFIKNVLNVHCEKGTLCGVVTDDVPIDLTNDQAILIIDNGISIIE